jgi:hypothetical protein
MTAAIGGEGPPRVRGLVMPEFSPRGPENLAVRPESSCRDHRLANDDIVPRTGAVRTGFSTGNVVREALERGLALA